MKPRVFCRDFALAAGVFAAAAAILHGVGLYPATADDYPRQAFAATWALDPFFALNDYYWLPLQFWLAGVWRWLAPAGLEPLWYVPLSVAQLAVTAALLAAAARRLAGEEPRARAWAGGIALALLLSVPFVLRQTVGLMAELSMLMCLAGFLAALLRLAQGGGGRGTLALGIVALAGLSMTRYEMWPVTALAWGMLIAQRRRAGLNAGTAGRAWIAEGILTAAVLAVFPLVWLALNAREFGSPLHFIAAADPGINRAPWLIEAGVPRRMVYLTRKAAGQGMAVGLALLATVRIWRSLSGLRLVLIPALTCGALYYLVAFTEMIHTFWLQRLAFPCLILLLPLAAAGLGYAALRHPLRVRFGVLLLILLQLAIGVKQRFGGPTLTEQSRPLTHELEQAARQHPGFRVIVTDPEALGRGINFLRFYAGSERVLLQEWIDAGQRFDGPVLLVTPPEAPGPAADGMTFGQYYLWIERWPQD